MTDNLVQMRIPRSNPLFDFVARQNFYDPIPLVTLKVGDVKARLALTAVVDRPHRQYDPNDEDYLETEWHLLPPRPTTTQT